MSPLVVFPSWSDLVASISPYSVGLFSSLIFIGAAILGIIVGGLFVRYLLRGVMSAVKQVTGGGRRGGGRRRR